MKRHAHTSVVILSALALAVPAASASASPSPAPWVERPLRDPGSLSASRAASGPLAASRRAAEAVRSLLRRPFVRAEGSATLSGHVYDPAGAPLAGASVGWIAPSAGGVAKGQGTTNAAGAYSLAGAPGAWGDGSVWASPADGSSYLTRYDAHWAAAGETTFDFSPEPLAYELHRGGQSSSWQSALLWAYGGDGDSYLAASTVVRPNAAQSSSTVYGAVPALPGLYDVASVNFWSNEGMEIPVDGRVGAGGRTRPSPVQNPSDLAFADHSHGWVAGVGIAATVDGGETWTVQTAPAGGGWLSIDAADASHAIAVRSTSSGPSAVWTSDGGATWTPASGLVDDGPIGLGAVDVVDASHAWAVGEANSVYATTDGGSTWKLQAQLADATHALFDIAFSDLQHGYAVGSPGCVFSTSDGGVTWTETTIAPGYTLRAVDAVGADHAWTAGMDGAAYRTADGGETWTVMTPKESTFTRYYSMEFTDALRGWVAGMDGIFRTVDGGETWSLDTWRGLGFTAVDMDTATSGWALDGEGNVIDTVDDIRWGAPTIVAEQYYAQRLWVGRPALASGPAGGAVRLTLENFPIGYKVEGAGVSDYPASARVTDLGDHTTSGAGDDPWTVRVPATATPGYFYWLEVTHADGALVLDTVYQVCAFKPSAARIRTGQKVTLRGIVPVSGHAGSTKGRPRTVYLFQRPRAAQQPTSLDPTRQGWKYVGKYRTDGLGAFRATVPVRKTSWFVALYEGGGATGPATPAS